MQLVHYWIVERRPWIGSVCGRLRNRGGRGRVGIRIHANGQKVHFGSTRSAYVHEEAELSYRFSGWERTFICRITVIVRYELQREP